MAKKASIQARLSITDSTTGVRFNNLGSGAYTADVVGSGGPYPGTVAAPVTGATVNLKSQLSDPSLYTLGNVGTVPVDYGVYDVSRGLVHLWGRVYPGEQAVGRFSPYFFGETGPGTAGTGTIGADDNLFYVRGVGTTGYLNISAFDY